MKPDEWIEGIENEAEHAPDPVWAGQARLSAEWFAPVRGLGFSVAVYALLAMIHLAFVVMLKPSAATIWFFLDVHIAVAGAGVLLGCLYVNYWTVFAGALLYLPMVWLGGLTLQEFWPFSTSSLPEFSGGDVLVLPLFALNSARLVLLFRRSRSLKT